ncbi:MAG: hypothetical protein ACI9O6_000869 [Glaciecola sp.]|jgi:hypothetical protein
MPSATWMCSQRLFPVGEGLFNAAYNQRAECQAPHGCARSDFFLRGEGYLMRLKTTVPNAKRHMDVLAATFS